MFSSKAYQTPWDWAGGIAAFLCFLHCVATPLMLTIVPIWGGKVGFSTSLEISILAAAFIFAAIAVYRGFFWHHHNYKVLLVFILGFALLTAGTLLGETAEIALHGAASVVLAAGHIWNGKLCRECNKCAHSTE